MLGRKRDAQRAAGVNLYQPDAERLTKSGQYARCHGFQRALRGIGGQHDKLIPTQARQGLSFVQAAQDRQRNGL